MTTDTLTDLQSGFKEAMAHMCAPVTVITTMDGPHPHGTTVSALMSLSMDPLLIAVAMATSSESLAAVKRTGVFAVNVLGAHQQDAALRFATKGDDKFDDFEWTQQGSLPRLGGSAIWLSCRLDSILPGGDHEILVGEVREVETDTAAPPLTYHGRRFGTHVAHRS